MTFQTLLAVLGSTREGLLMVRETVAVETRARRATSWIFITGRRGPIPGTRFTASKWYLLPRRRPTSWIFITARRGPIPGTRFTASKWYLIPRRASLKQA